MNAPYTEHPLMAEVRRLTRERDHFKAKLGELGPRSHDDGCNGYDDVRRCWCGFVEHNDAVRAALEGP